MPAWNAYSFAFGPILALVGIGLFVIILRWAFARGASVVAAPARAGADQEYGLLCSVASPTTYIEGEFMRRTLESSGIKANLAQTLDGPRVMVWPADVATAREILSPRN